MTHSHRLQVMQSLKDTMNSLATERNTNLHSAALYNISHALIGFYEDLATEFENLKERLNNIEARLER